MLLPWILSLILGVIIPSGLSIYSFLLHSNLYRQQQEIRRRRRRDDDDFEEDESEEQRTRRREKRLHKLLKQLHSKTEQNQRLKPKAC